MEFENFMHMRKFSLRNDYYCFVDTGEFISTGNFRPPERQFSCYNITEKKRGRKHGEHTGKLKALLLGHGHRQA